jgi:hypothetical protein
MHSKAQGHSAVVLVKSGSIRADRPLVAGTTWTRPVRMLDCNGGLIKPSITMEMKEKMGKKAPKIFAHAGAVVQLVGLPEPIAAGTSVLTADDMEHAKEVVEHRLRAAEEGLMDERQRARTFEHVGLVAQVSFQFRFSFRLIMTILFAYFTLIIIIIHVYASAAETEVCTLSSTAAAQGCGADRRQRPARRPTHPACGL